MAATIVVGLGFGDEGKGSIVDYLVRRDWASAVVRFNGGAQCAHHVVTPDGRQHSFAQFGSGTFVAGVETILSQDVLVNPLNLLVEEAALREQGVTDALDRLTIDPYAVIITPVHVAANRMAELARDGQRHERRHGSCGQGIGEARNDSLTGPTLRAYDLLDPKKIERLIRGNIESRLNVTHRPAEYRIKLLELLPPWRELIEAYRIVGERVAPVMAKLRAKREENIVFEGAQGILLDETYGITPPHVTWTDTTAKHALAMAASIGIAAKTIGVTRSYLTRHGPGPFPTEDQANLASTRKQKLTDETNPENEWQGPFRVGQLDFDLLRYATRVQPVDEIALNHLDRYKSLAELDEKIFDATGASVTIAGFGPTAADKQIVPRLAASELRR